MNPQVLGEPQNSISRHSYCALKVVRFSLLENCRGPNWPLPCINSRPVITAMLRLIRISSVGKKIIIVKVVINAPKTCICHGSDSVGWLFQKGFASRRSSCADKGFQSGMGIASKSLVFRENAVKTRRRL